MTTARWRRSLLVVAGALGLAGCGGPESGTARPDSAPSATIAPETSSASASTTTGPGAPTPTLLPPPGWAVSADGRIAAADAADLTAPMPGGPRIRLLATPADAEVAVAEALAAATGTDAAVVARPVSEVELAGMPAVAITLRESQGVDVVLREYVFGPTADGSVVAVVLECPPDRWDDARTMLAAAVALDTG